MQLLPKRIAAHAEQSTNNHEIFTYYEDAAIRQVLQDLEEKLGYELGGMMEVTCGCEANGAVPINDCHVNTFNCQAARAKMGIYGDFKTIVEDCEEEGGYSFLDHTDLLT